MDIPFDRKPPELSGQLWINSPPLALDGLRGKVVLLDFWTYSCVNCLRTLPALKRMWQKYRRHGLVIIGVHTPEFEFERDPKNVRVAVKRLGINYPVLSDPERASWERYGNRYWPRVAVIGRDGLKAMDHTGEGGYGEIERRVVQELGIVADVPAEKPRKQDFKTTSESYAGKLRNPGLCSGCAVPPGEAGMSLSGEWRQEPEYLEFLGGEGSLTLRFHAKEANAVLSGKGSAKALAFGKRRSIRVTRPDMYKIVRNRKPRAGELVITPFKGMRLYAFTFG